jgi:hypothetical protein
VLVNRKLRRIFSLMWDEVTGSWRKMHNEKFLNLYFSPKKAKGKAVPLHAMQALGGEEV